MIGRLITDLEYSQCVVPTLEELAESRLVPASDVLVDRFQSLDGAG